MPDFIVTVSDSNGPVSGARIAILDAEDTPLMHTTETDPEKIGVYTVQGLSPGTYRVVVSAVGRYAKRRFIQVTEEAGGTEEFLLAGDATPNGALAHSRSFALMNSTSRFAMDRPVNYEDVTDAILLFHVASLTLTGQTVMRVGGEDLTDVLGVLSLHYGLQNHTLSTRGIFAEETSILEALQQPNPHKNDVRPLSELAAYLETNQAWLRMLTREARRQFHLDSPLHFGANHSLTGFPGVGGTGNEGNTDFPVLFRRLVEACRTPLVTENLRNLTEYQRTEAIRELRNLRELIVQIVTSLSKTGTRATSQLTADWDNFSADALLALETVTPMRNSPDEDERTEWAVLAAVTGRSLASDICPYYTLAFHGATLLEQCMVLHKRIASHPAPLTDSELIDIFQPDDERPLTDLLQLHADALAAAPVLAW